jgi:hypothetical protein
VGAPHYTSSMALFISPVQTENLQLTPELVGDTLVVHLKGNADSASNDTFGAFISKLHAEAQRSTVKEVRLDLTQLYFMTSSCIKCFVTWIGFINAAPSGKQYALHFVVNPNLRWQKRNLDVLLQLSPRLTLTEST